MTTPITTLTKDQEGMVKAIWGDLSQSYTSLTLDHVREQAIRILNGERVADKAEVHGVPGMWIEDTFRRAGWIE